MKKQLYFFLWTGSIIFFLTSCAKDDPINDIPLENPLDIELKEMLEDFGGTSYFVLPASNDYSNIPQDPHNAISSEKIALGKKLFFETGLAQNAEMEEGMETYSCATCHIPGSSFQAGVRQGIGDGGMGIGTAGEARVMNPNYEEELLDVPPIRVPNNLNVAFITNTTWNGKLGATGANVGTEHLWVDDLFLETNSLGYTGVETQAIAGLEFHRMVVDQSLVFSSYYRDLFDMSFPEYPEEERYTFETAGLAISAYERAMMTNEAPFQEWLRGESNAMTENQKIGAALFFGKAGCVNCHTGPALNDNSFHAIGMGELTGADILGDFSDIADEVARGRGGFTGVQEDDYKFKVPQLYNLRDANFLGHGATFSSLRDVVEYKNAASPQNLDVPATQLSEHFQALDLTETELDQLMDFLENALYDDNMQRYVTSTIASGNCFPNNDSQSQADMGCN